MAGHEWEDWFEREEFIGQISDIRVQNLQVEREVVQKRTFTRWMNLHLEKCDPPIEVNDLFQDIQDGRILMALLEELSGCKLLHGFKKSSHRIFRLNNIAKVLSFLEERNVKLVSIDASDVADGNSSIILGLIWNIILFFQIKELTGNIRSQFPSCSSLSSIPTSSDSDASFCSTPSDERQSASTAIREHSKAIKKLLQWVQKRTRKYGVAVQDFGKSWTSGLAFLAVIKSIDSSLVDMRKALLRTARENLEDAFRIAHYSLGIPRLLEAEDVTINAPDEQSIIMYVSQFLEHFPGVEEPEEAYQIIERSVSMGRLNLRESEPDYLRNGTYRSRVKERSHMFQRDCGPKAPPKILISSVSEDRSVMSPTYKVAAARSWSSDDILADSSQDAGAPVDALENDKKPAGEVSADSTSVSPQPSSAHSPTGSSVPESANTESVIGDSAIGSPDSWVESELGVTPDKFSESRSDSSLCDSGTAWEVYRATPVDVMPLEEGFTPPSEDRAPDEQSLAESYVDEGIYSLESTQCKVQGHSEEKEAEAVNGTEKIYYNHTEDRTIEQAADPSETEATATVVSFSHSEKDAVPKERQPSLGSAEDDLPKTNSHPPAPDHFGELVEQNSLDASSSGEHRDAQDFSEEVQIPEVRVNHQTDSLQQVKEPEEFENHPASEKTDSPLQDETQNSRNESELSEENKVFVKIEEETREELSNNSPETPDETQTTNQDGASKTHLGISVPLISILGASQELDEEETCDPEERGNTDEDVCAQRKSGREETSADQNPDDQIFILTENDQIPAELPSITVSEEVENEHLDDTDGHNIRQSSNAEATETSEADQTREALHDGPETDLIETQFMDTEEASTEQQDKTAETLSDGGAANSQQNASESVSLKQEAEISSDDPESKSTNKGSFYSDFERCSPTEDLGGDRVEPMDLFYPDKEELMFTEPPDTEMQSWPSVLSVSALQPAPASEVSPDDQEPSLLDQDFSDGPESFVQEQEKVVPETDSAPESREPCLLNPICARENMEPVRIDASFIRQDDILSAPVLRHRKGARPAESADNQRTLSKKTDDENSDFWFGGENWELYLLLLLWLLLYCFWLLPQMDLKTLPSLLLNLNR
ncbi:calmin [Salarias fasciatus]|uniref:Calmin n=1 Tax=Salarias fasciatus TaxID=181472 RepID=A0A672J9J6_SALFA|nr:calmin [Salarias fasciatus]XP_029972009.1 calmin [Salarias fasciatus]